MSFHAVEWARAKHMKPSRKMVLLMICQYADAEGIAYPGMARLAEDCSMDERTIRRHVAALEGDLMPGEGGRGAFTRERRYRYDDKRDRAVRTSDSYKINWSWIPSEMRGADPDAQASLADKMSGKAATDIKEGKNPQSNNDNPLIKKDVSLADKMSGEESPLPDKNKPVTGQKTDVYRTTVSGDTYIENQIENQLERQGADKPPGNPEKKTEFKNGMLFDNGLIEGSYYFALDLIRLTKKDFERFQRECPEIDIEEEMRVYETEVLACENQATLTPSSIFFRTRNYLKRKNAEAARGKFRQQGGAHV